MVTQNDFYFTEPDTDSEDDSNSETKPVCVSVVAAGAEMDNDMDNGWEESEYNMYYNDDDLLYGDDPLEMERFEFSWKNMKCLRFHEWNLWPKTQKEYLQIVL